MVVDAPGIDAAQLSVHSVEIGEHDQSRCEPENTDGVEENGHGSGESALAAEALLAAVHPAVVGFVIVTHQMENSMKYKNPHFFAEGAAEAAGVAPCDGRRDGNISEIRIGSSGRNRFRQMPRR